MTDIPSSVALPSDKCGKISRFVAELPEKQDDPEGSPYVISFAKYNDKMCEIGELRKNKARRAMQTLKTIGTKVYSNADFNKNAIIALPVYPSGEYKKLYSGLEQDIELKEIKLQDTGRIFYFSIESRRTFYVVAITESHFETDKTRR